MKFLEFCRTAKSVFSDEVNHVIEFRDGGYTGKGWDEYDPKLGDIIWPIEEASWLRLTYNEEKFHHDAERLVSFIDKKFNLKTTTIGIFLSIVSIFSTQYTRMENQLSGIPTIILAELA